MEGGAFSLSVVWESWLEMVFGRGGGASAVGGGGLASGGGLGNCVTIYRQMLGCVSVCECVRVWGGNDRLGRATHLIQTV